MNPADLNLPRKFHNWRRIDKRRTQWDVIVDAACSDRRFTIINSPTGTGKSSIYMGLAALLDTRTLVLTQTKGLQDQLGRDFKDMGLVQIQGQNNYECLYFDDGVRRKLPGCDDGPCHAGIECTLREQGCLYYDAVRRAARSKLVVTNYSYWMTVQRYSDPETIGTFGALILDEAHESARSLSDFVQIHLESREIEHQLGLHLPYGASIAEWVEWASHEALPVCRRALESARAATALHHTGIAVVRRLQDLEGQLLDLSRASGWRRVDAPDPPAWVPGTTTDWIVEETPNHVTFQPVWASGYAEPYLFARIPRVILVSATVTPKDAQYLGVADTDLRYLQYPSPFNAKIRQVYVVPTAKVSRNMSKGEERIWLNRIDQIIQKEAIEKSAKGIIHTRSYARAQAIFAHSKYKDILYIHDARRARETVAAFKKAGAPAVLISPAVSTGYDFPYDEARFQIIAKIPFIDNRPAVIRARHASDKSYLDYTAMVELIQMCGRGVRSDDDRCVTYIIDDNWHTWFYPRNKRLVPKWFRSAIRRVNSMTEIR